MQEDNNQSITLNNEGNLEEQMLQWNHSYETVNLDDPRSQCFDKSRTGEETAQVYVQMDSEWMDQMAAQADGRYCTGYFPDIG